MTGGMTFLTVAFAGKYRWNEFYLPVTVGIVSSTVDKRAAYVKTLQGTNLLTFGIGLAVTVSPKLGLLSNTQINTKILF